MLNILYVLLDEGEAWDAIRGTRKKIVYWWLWRHLVYLTFVVEGVNSSIRVGLYKYIYDRLSNFNNLWISADHVSGYCY